MIGGVLDIVSTLSDFLPSPVGAIMGPISGIFNMAFGIGAGPSAEDVIREAWMQSKCMLNYT